MTVEQIAAVQKGMRVEHVDRLLSITGVRIGVSAGWPHVSELYEWRDDTAVVTAIFHDGRLSTKSWSLARGGS